MMIMLRIAILAMLNLFVIIIVLALLFLLQSLDPVVFTEVFNHYSCQLSIFLWLAFLRYDETHHPSTSFGSPHWPVPLLKTFFRGHVASLGPPDHDHHDGDGDIKEKNIYLSETCIEHDIIKKSRRINLVLYSWWRRYVGVSRSRSLTFIEIFYWKSWNEVAEEWQGLEDIFKCRAFIWKSCWWRWLWCRWCW